MSSHQAHSAVGVVVDSGGRAVPAPSDAEVGYDPRPSALLAIGSAAHLCRPRHLAQIAALVVRLAVGYCPRCVRALLPLVCPLMPSASYGMFFATFDITRRLGLRVKSVVSRRLGGPVDGSAQGAESKAAELRAAAIAPPSQTPTSARLAQALTIVTGGVVAAHLAELSGRPFRACQRYAGTATAEREKMRAAGKPVPDRYKRPIRFVWREHGLRAFTHRDDAPLAAKHQAEAQAKGGLQIVARFAGRVVWRVASVGPWGLGFLMFAWIGGEV